MKKTNRVGWEPPDPQGSRKDSFDLPFFGFSPGGWERWKAEHPDLIKKKPPRNPLPEHYQK